MRQNSDNTREIADISPGISEGKYNNGLILYSNGSRLLSCSCWAIIEPFKCIFTHKKQSHIIF